MELWEHCRAWLGTTRGVAWSEEGMIVHGATSGHTLCGLRIPGEAHRQFQWGWFPAGRGSEITCKRCLRSAASADQR